MLGRHFCLKCLITSAEAKVALPDHSVQLTLRSLDSIAADLQRFAAAGDDLNNAKSFNNVISPAFFDIPLDQVSLSLKSVNNNVLSFLWNT